MAFNFTSMVRCGRIPKKPEINKEQEPAEWSGQLVGGSLMQVLGSVEVDIVQRILKYLDPISLMHVEETSLSLRQFQCQYNTWRHRAMAETCLSIPSVQERWLQVELTVPASIGEINQHLQHKAKCLRGWNLQLNWQRGQFKLHQLVSFNCNHESCNARCQLKLRTILNPEYPEEEDLLPSQIIAGDLVVVRTFDQFMTNDDRMMFYSIRQDKKVEVFDPADDGICSLIGSSLSEDRSRISVLYYVWHSGIQVNQVIQAKLVLMEAVTYKIKARMELPLSPELKRRIYDYDRTEEECFCFSDENLLYFINDTLLVIDPHSDISIIKTVIKVPQLTDFKVNVYQNYLCGLQPKQAVVFFINLSEGEATEIWRKTSPSSSFPPINITSLGLAFPFLYIGKSHGILETWNVQTDDLVSEFDKAEIVMSPRAGIHDVKILRDRVLTTNFGGHLCVWDREVLESRHHPDKVPGYKIELKYEQGFYADETQLVYIEEMGDKDMEMMTVSRLDFWPINKENIDQVMKVQAVNDVTYKKVKRKREVDPRRKIVVAAKRQKLDSAATSSSHVDEEEEKNEGEYDYREEDLLVDDREEEKWEDAYEYEEDPPDDDYDYQDDDDFL